MISFAGPKSGYGKVAKKDVKQMLQAAGVAVD